MGSTKPTAPQRPTVGAAAATDEAGREVDEETLDLRRVQAEAFLTISGIGRKLEQQVAALFEAEGLTDVTPAQANALMILFAAKRPLHARALATRMELSQVTVGRFVKALAQQGWVAREADPDDSRAMLIRPTPKAYATLPTFIAVSNTLLDRAFAGFSRPEIRRIATVVGRVRSNLDEPT
ncbi:MAG: MarR family transcriptional regulator [Myxococcota bacterium]